MIDGLDIRLQKKKKSGLPGTFKVAKFYTNGLELVSREQVISQVSRSTVRGCQSHTCDLVGFDSDMPIGGLRITPTHHPPPNQGARYLPLNTYRVPSTARELLIVFLFEAVFDSRKLIFRGSPTGQHEQGLSNEQAQGAKSNAGSPLSKVQRTCSKGIPAKLHNECLQAEDATLKSHGTPIFYAA